MIGRPIAALPCGDHLPEAVLQKQTAFTPLLVPIRTTRLMSSITGGRQDGVRPSKHQTVSVAPRPLPEWLLATVGAPRPWVRL